MARIFSEIRSDYFDSYDNEWCIDAWVSDDDDEGGVVAARININTFEVKYTREEYKQDEGVVNAIKEKLIEILNDDPLWHDIRK